MDLQLTPVLHLPTALGDCPRPVETLARMRWHYRSPPERPPPFTACPLRETGNRHAPVGKEVGQRRYAHHLDKVQGKADRDGCAGSAMLSSVRSLLAIRAAWTAPHSRRLSTRPQHTAGQQLPINQVTHKHHEGVLQQTVDRCPITKARASASSNSSFYRSLQR